MGAIGLGTRSEDFLVKRKKKFKENKAERGKMKGDE